MRTWKTVTFAFLVLPVGFYSRADAVENSLAAWWKFDDGKLAAALDSVSGKSDAISGNSKYVEGVRGKALRFDGYTTHVTRKAESAPKLTDAFTIEAWVAMQTYPWNWTGIVDQASQVTAKSEPAVAGTALKTGLIGPKFNSPDFTNPEETDLLRHVNHEWTGGLNDWSARWRGYIEAPVTGEVTFAAEADNGLKLEIDGRVVIDGWGRDKPRTGRLSMTKGKKHPVVLSYFQDGDPSFLRLYWRWPAQEKTLVPAEALWHSEQHQRQAEQEALQPASLEEKDTKTHLFFGIDAQGHLGMKLNIDGRLYECATEKQLPLLRWSHICGTFDQVKGITVYINGEQAGALSARGKLNPERASDLLIGKSHEKMSPAGTEREASRKTLSNMVFDGLIDEVKIYRRALSAPQIAESFASVRPKTPQPLTWRTMPSGPRDLPQQFKAYYTRLRYAEQWEEPWRIGSHPDILVIFDESPVRVVFWRGTSYGASWVTENGIWMSDQSLEDSGTGWGLSEHMADKQCRYSRVRLIENHDARIVVHWRYAVADIKYTINHTDPETNWGDWVDEYYTIYPDAVATRKQVLWTTSDVGGFQWQETIFFSQPGTRPDDNIRTKAFTLANMDGQTHTYSWAKGAPESYRKPEKAGIQLTNLKARYKPFIIFRPGRKITAFGGGDERSKFPWWNHWPVSQIPSDGRIAFGPDRPSHSSLSNRRPKATPGQGYSYTAASLYGMTNRSIRTLVPLARSWNYPPQLNLASRGFESDGFSKYERAYVLARKDDRNSSTLQFTLPASKKSPVVNPALIIRNWGEAQAKMKINGKTIKRGKTFRLGHRRTLNGTDLIVWIQKDSTEPITVSICPEPD